MTLDEIIQMHEYDGDMETADLLRELKRYRESWGEVLEEIDKLLNTSPGYVPFCDPVGMCRKIVTDYMKGEGRWSNRN